MADVIEAIRALLSQPLRTGRAQLFAAVLVDPAAHDSPVARVVPLGFPAHFQVAFAKVGRARTGAVRLGPAAVEAAILQSVATAAHAANCRQ